MLRIVAEPTFTHVVEVHTPKDGGHAKESFKTTFRVLPIDKVGEFDLNSQEGSADFLRAAIVGMDDLADESGQQLPYSDALRDQLIMLPYVRMAMARAYFTAVNKVAMGNSNGPAALG